MLSPAVLAALILGATIVLFVSDRLRPDLVGMLAVLALAATGVATVPEALAGFADPAMLTIAGLFVVGEALTATGVADWLGQTLEQRAGHGEARVTLAVMVTTALLSAFMSSTGTVAILLPVVGTLAQRRGIAPARLLMPLAFGAHLGSNLTLISTPPNMIVSEALRGIGHEPFRFFSFTAPGLLIGVLGLTYMVWIGRRALPGGAGGTASRVVFDNADLAADYGLTRAMRTLRITPRSPLVGRTIAQANLRTEHRLTILVMERPGRRGRPEVCKVVPATLLAAGDELRVLGSDEAIARARDVLALEEIDTPAGFPLADDQALVEVVLPRRSRIAGHTPRDARIRDRYQMTMLGLRRSDGTIVVDALTLRDLVLQAGDTLLLCGRRTHIRNLRTERADLVLVAEPDGKPGVLMDPRGAAHAIAIVLAMLTLMALGVVPNVIAVLAAVIALVLTGCVRPTSMYSSVSWESVMLIACMIPLARALETSGALAIAVGELEGVVRGASPTLVLALIVAATSAMGMVLSNTATAVLIAPLAVRIAAAAELAPEPLLIGVAFASTAAFASPIASPVNVLVMGPAGYRFADYVRVGLPLQLLVLTATVLVVPLFWPF